MAYITEKMRDELRMQHFRDALSGTRKKPEPEETLKDHGVSDPLSEGDIEGLGRFYKREIAQEQRAEEALISGNPVEEEALEREQSGLMARVLAGIRSERASRAQAVVSKSSTAASFETPDHPGKETHVSLDFHRKAIDPRNNADPAARDVNAVQMIMENILDWEFHERHSGDTVTQALIGRLMKTLKMNLEQSCPSVKNRAVLEHFEELAAHSWVGDIVNFRHTTERVIGAYLDAQNGNPEPLIKLEKFLEGALSFHQRFYAEQPEGRVPLRTLAQAMEKQGSRPGTLGPRPA